MALVSAEWWVWRCAWSWTWSWIVVLPCSLLGVLDMVLGEVGVAVRARGLRVADRWRAMCRGVTFNGTRIQEIDRSLSDLRFSNSIALTISKL